MMACVGLGVTPATANQSGEESPAPIDHFVFVVPDLQKGILEAERQLDVQVAQGGEHPSQGTANAIIPMAGGLYWEILGPNPKNETTVGLGEWAAKLSTPDLVSFAVSTKDFEHIQNNANSLGLAVSKISNGSRITPEGKLLNWRTIRLSDERYRGLIPFFIDWGDSQHPSESGPAIASVRYVVALHPDAEGLRRVYKALGIDIPVHSSNKPGLIVCLETGRNTVIFQGSASGIPALETSDH